ncbi:pantoate--beta-alanine ligase [Bradyrhizobium yuanmingense]|uniref:pantoate--beta-alanine ligase n=1 Tax=Bradyrhizobium yuanmingense TaxID=108015 RepID=UPI000FE3B7EF|nr:pantoate--beta-alanine ligase [Bradyrhizobium yuanmingense]TGN74190.1 pantoate--beta-alanine ligase [Bradyrhizobium yuanmingense]
MRTITTVSELRLALAEARNLESRIGLVPTMGYLHDGHMALVQASRRQCSTNVVSIFVNPTQFGPKEDLSIYPRDFPRDEELCRAAGVDILFAPQAEEVYPPQFNTFVEPGALARPLCGSFRAGHFRGVATVVSKLFNMVQPDVAFFGQKDFQQCAVVRQLAADLNFPIEIVTVPTVRDPDGLAMSSRNRYLSAAERARALSLSRGLFEAEADFRAGERDPVRLLLRARRPIENVDELQYLEIVDTQTLEPVANRVSRPAAICVAAYAGSTRLIDNVVLNPDSYAG